MKFKVSYTEIVFREIDIEANSAKDAEDMVMDGDADYDMSHEVDATVNCVNEVVALE